MDEHETIESPLGLETHEMGKRIRLIQFRLTKDTC